MNKYFIFHPTTPPQHTIPKLILVLTAKMHVVLK